MKENFQTDIHMTTEHSKYNKKAKVSFHMVVAKVVITGVLMATLGTTALPLPAYAAEMGQSVQTVTIVQGVVNAIPTPSRVLVNGKEVKFDSYNCRGILKL